MGNLIDSLLRSVTTYWHRLGGYNPYVVAVELLLIALAVGWVMRFLRGTRGARLIKGVALMLAGVYVVMRLLPKTYRWERIEFLYGHFLVFAFVAVVVAFQPELRRALIQIGQARILRGAHSEMEKLVDTLTDSAAHLSRSRTGAIVAVERSVGLGTLTEAGTPVDAQVTGGLLSTIFYPGSPLHDMGVVIQAGRIAAAGCQFPLAESEDVDPSLGSRHRAALGLATESDAVVLVVSEETGRISLACEGQLYLGLEVERLREMLLALLAPELARKRRKAARAGKGAPS